MKEVTVTHYRDDKSCLCIWLPLSNSKKRVHMREDDFNSLYHLGLIPIFKMMDGQIWERGSSRISVTRLVADAKQGEKVEVIDNDACNLKIDNLIKTRGGSSKYNARERLSKLERLRLVKLNHVYISPSWKEEAKPQPSWKEQ